MTNAEIREYKAGDSSAVRDLILSILQKEYPFDQSAYKETDINDISGTYSGKGNVFFVAEKNGNVIGTVGIKRDASDTALLRRFFVNEGFRKKGIGTMLLKNAIDFCKAQKYRKIIFRATDRMIQAMNLCKKMGFEEKENIEVSGFNIHKFVLKV